MCPTCDRKTVAAWGSASAGTAAASEILDLREEEAEGEGLAEVAALTGNGARAAEVPAAGGTVAAAADVVRRGGGPAGQFFEGNGPARQGLCGLDFWPCLSSELSSPSVPLAAARARHTRQRLSYGPEATAAL